MPENLFGRELVLIIGGTRIATRLRDDTVERLGEEAETTQSLRVTFEVTKHLKKDPNSAEISIYNLSKQSRTRFQKKNIPCVLQAGYASNIGTIFRGNLDFGENIRDGTEWITTFESTDGGLQHRTARVNRSFSGKVKKTDVLKAAVSAMNINLGNTFDALLKGDIRTAIQEYQNGYVLSGPAEQEAHKIAQSMGYDLSVQDGTALLLGPNDTINRQAIILNASSGLIASPEQGEDGIISCTSLLQPELQPGRQLTLQSKEVDGNFRIEKSVMVGDTEGGNDWVAQLESKPLK